MPVFHHRLETALPLRSENGTIELSGWCLNKESAGAPRIKAVWRTGETSLVHRGPRPDATAAFGLHREEEPLCGFHLTGQLKPGAHLLTLLAAELGTDEWTPLMRFTALVFSRGLQAAIEFPTDLTIRENIRIQGWCVHPERSIREISLHYGTRRLRCEFGLPRDDVAALAPSSPDASRGGFLTSKNASAGRGPLRVVALDAHGSRQVARTDRFVDIDADEENPTGLNLPEQLARVSPTRRMPLKPKSRPTSAGGKRILFVLYGDFTSNSATHVAGLANAMHALGHECVVAVPENSETLAHRRSATFAALNFADVPRDAAVFREGKKPDIIHAWTTRENVRQFCERIRAESGAKLVIHLEDHELRILELNLGRSLSELFSLPAEELDALIPRTLSHPRHSKEFLSSADGVTVITEKLRELVPGGAPVHLFWPAADSEVFFPRPIPSDLRAALGWGSDHTVLFYHGNVHAANRREVSELYRAVHQLNAEGHRTTLIRTGRDFADFAVPTADSPHVLHLGQIEQHDHLAPLLALADFFVQPGEPDTFNDYRFPSKLPEFFALGRPVILPRTNLGNDVRHGEDAYVLASADATSIVHAIRELRASPELRAQLSKGAAAFAERRFSWQRSGQGVLNFYDQILPLLSDPADLHARHSTPSP